MCMYDMNYMYIYYRYSRNRSDVYVCMYVYFSQAINMYNSTKASVGAAWRGDTNNSVVLIVYSRA